ncbi:DUF4959 domain-containing protein [Chitinophaga horti]|uniref:DUF4959 domain-containing protein n=1 Tax=Chitinophaga horti TaxID=2920382 RepID=A0ABY6J3T8_9BACT|nr:DUF4959 domain-containing protein [Chitinophaga horti]UYQ94339.1 DUF4959 domain-containing protein [Chitinophaga horti]
MRINIKYYALLLPALLSIASCKEDLGLQEPSGSDKTPPAKVSNVVVTNQAGKALLTYDLPADKNLLYVKAAYVLPNGTKMEAKSSYYNNSLTVEGFADTDEHEIMLYSVSRTNVLSEGQLVKIKPLEAPIWEVYRSIKIENAFGGYNLTARNTSKADVSLLVLKDNVFKELEVDNSKSIFTNVDSILSKVRGLDTIQYKFAFMVRDKWGNTTDTMFHTVKPIYEVEFSPLKFAPFALPGDAPQVSGARMEFMWDGKFGWGATSFTHQVNGGNNPHMVTVDIGVLGKLSRVWIRPYPEGNRWYFLTTMKRFEIYGATAPSLTGALDATWTLLGSYTVIKPSGTPYGSDTGADQATAAAGFSWDVDLAAGKVRYLRIRCLENFAGGTAQSINELKVYGDNR